MLSLLRYIRLLHVLPNYDKSQMPYPSTPPSSLSPPKPVPDGGKELVRTNEIWAYYTELPNSLRVTIETPLEWSAHVEADVNQDGKKATPDVSYSVGSDDRICTVKVFSETSTSGCGVLVSKATLQVRREGNRKISTFTIPKSELSATGKAAGIALTVWTGSTWYRYRQNSDPYPYIVPFLGN